MSDRDKSTAGDETLEATAWQQRHERDDMDPKPEDTRRRDHQPEKKRAPAGEAKLRRNGRSVPIKESDRKQATEEDYRNLTSGTGSGVTRGDSGVD